MTGGRHPLGNVTMPTVGLVDGVATGAKSRGNHERRSDGRDTERPSGLAIGGLGEPIRTEMKSMGVWKPSRDAEWFERTRDTPRGAGAFPAEHLWFYGGH
jgi:hypothetical protein